MTRSEYTQHADPAVQRRRAMRETKLPAGVEPAVLVGQRAIAGETVLADLDGKQPQRQGRAS